MRAEISEWVAEELRRPARPRAAALEESGAACVDAWRDRTYETMDTEQLLTAFLETNDDTNPKQLTALVKNLKSKKGKGKGKGKQVCYECDSEAHIARDYHVRAARVAAGGPERFPRDQAPRWAIRAAKATRVRAPRV